MRNATPGWSMVARRDFINKEGSTPGPGSYLVDDTSHAKKNSNHSSFGTSGRHVSSSRVPGPGAYDHGTATGKGLAFSFTPRRTPRAISKETPGPGAYGQSLHAQMPLEGPKVVMTSRLADRKKEYIPGPGAYEPKEGLKIAKKTKAPGGFGFSCRADPTPHNQKNTPGPGTYGNDVCKPSYAVEKPPVLKSTKSPKALPGPMLETATSYEAAPVEMITAESPRRQIKLTSVQKPSPKGQASGSAAMVFPNGGEKDIPLISPKSGATNPPLASPKADQKKPPRAEVQKPAVTSSKADMKKSPLASRKVEEKQISMEKSDACKEVDVEVVVSPMGEECRITEAKKGEDLSGGRSSADGGGASTCTPDLSRHLDSEEIEIEEDFDDDFEELSDGDEESLSKTLALLP